MIWLRKGFVFLLSVVLLIALVGGVAAININQDLANPTRLENWLAASGIYKQVVAAGLQQAEKSSSTSGDSGTVSLSDPTVQQAAASAFSPALVEQVVNTFLNGNYDWLSGKKAVPDYNIDLTSAKASFASQVGQATQAHLASLPACTPTQLAQLPIPVDPLSITCRPATLDPKAEGDRVAQEINGNSNFLGNTVINASNLNQSQPIQPDSSQPQPTSQPYYKQLSWAPRAYQIGLKLPWVLGALALLCALGILFISLSRRRGFRRIGAVLLLAGLILVGVKFLADAAVSRFATLLAKSSFMAGLKQPINDLVHNLEPQLVRGYLVFGIAFVAIALLIFALLFRSRERAAKPVAKRSATSQPPATASDPVEPGFADSVPNETAANRLAPHRQPTAPTLSSGSEPKASSAKPKLAPLGKTPPRRKPPKLVQ